MGKQQRNRWEANVKALEIVGKAPEDVTQEEIEYLKKNYTSMGGLVPKGFHGGAFFTPTHVAKFIVEALQMPEGSRVLEPSCGSGVFIEHMKNCSATGLELDSTSAKVSSLIYPDAEIIQGNAFNHTRRDYYDFVVGNPPFGETVEIEGKKDFKTLRYTKKTDVSKGKSEFAFVELAIRAVKPGGYIAMILPLNLAFAQTAGKIRKIINETCWTIANIKLPPETFQHVGTSVATQILILRKTTPNVKKVKSYSIDAEFFEGQQPVFMAVVQDIGWDKKGKSTDKWNDGLTQLDTLLEAFTDDFLVRSNLYPFNPSWMITGKDVTFSPFLHEESPGYKNAKRYFRKEEVDSALLQWNEMTLGKGDGTSWDFYRQDELVEEYWEGTNTHGTQKAS